MQRIELVEHQRLRPLVDLERAVASVAAAAGLPRPLLGRRGIGEHLRQTLGGAAAGPEPVGVEGCLGGAHTPPMLADIVQVTDGLLPAWRQALTHDRGPLLVLGTPGSGKTALIGGRFRRLVESGEAPERLLVVAPTPGRAATIRARLEAEIDQGYDALHCLTPVGLARLLLEGA